MSIQLSYTDFVKLFQIDKPLDWLPSLIVKPEGVFVIPPAEDIDLTPNERATLAHHPTGIYSDPALRFPASVEKLEAFVDEFGLRGYIDAFDLLHLLEKSAFVAAHLEEQKNGAHFWPILARITGLRSRLKEEMGRAERNDKESRLVALRWVADQLDAAFDGMSMPSEVNGDASGKPDDATVIACLVDLMLTTTDAGTRLSVYESQNSVIDALLHHYPNVRGISSRNVAGKIAVGRKRAGLAAKR